MIDLKPYLEMTTMMVLATKDSEGNPYTCNVYFRSDENNNFYFKSKSHREHSKHILENQQIAWSIINTQKYQVTDSDKKGLQFQGVGQMLLGKEAEKISSKIYNKNMTFDEMRANGHYIFKCNPVQVKIWDEVLYGGDGKIIKF